MRSGFRRRPVRLVVSGSHEQIDNRLVRDQGEVDFEKVQYWLEDTDGLNIRM